MAYITFQPSDYFNTVLYTGNGSTQSITGVGFQPDWVWQKARNQTYDHRLFDAVRGTTKAIYSNTTGAEGTESGVTAFDSDGFSLGSNAGSNGNTVTYASWNWRAGNSAGSSNSDGTITSTVSANTTSGFSIAQWTGTGSNATIGHGLGVTPQCFIVKKTSGTSAWSMYHEAMGNTKFITLNDTSTATTGSTVWNNTSPTSSVFSVGTGDNGNASGATYIGYFFANKKGYSKFGSYTGNGNADGVFVYTGFKPAWFLWKRTDSAANWNLVDSKRAGYNVANYRLFPDASGTEDTQERVNLLSNGIKLTTTDVGSNASGGTYIYMAFAEEPLVSSNNIPATAR